MFQKKEDLAKKEGEKIGVGMWPSKQLWDKVLIEEDNC